MRILHTIHSGGQTGADEAGLFVGKRFGLKTGGMMPAGFKTQAGPRPEFAEMYGVKEHSSDKYPPRTYENVRDSDGTVRLGANFDTAGEVCTFKAITQYKKPHFDVDLSDPPPIMEFIGWLDFHDIGILNVAGNSERTYPGCNRWAVAYLSNAMFELGLKAIVTPEEILLMLGLGSSYKVTCNGQLISHIEINKT